MGLSNGTWSHAAKSTGEYAYFRRDMDTGAEDVVNEDTFSGDADLVGELRGRLSASEGEAARLRDKTYNLESRLRASERPAPGPTATGETLSDAPVSDARIRALLAKHPSGDAALAAMDGTARPASPTLQRPPEAAPRTAPGGAKPAADRIRHLLSKHPSGAAALEAMNA